ncbi:hypothetical protein X928_05385 [Petrotoga miotherma DSM 10691]|uniref:N-acetyltransferase domain-containing protein n=2 Tax=Petrotoga TaxID=28236 RepID=A0A2K1PCE5_9BACT|nr:MULTISPECIES: GNAT family protein [Petrotoga]MDK2907091.1 diamine N-acetyltransferase [Petrotoga sp.]PNS00347.1 hypothetical protein X928_05385 [Petrotoga miotherma DSM 10691]POZ92686.1 hypothetical protein AA81_05935 [Petrotoga halophila DSM 16923]
MDIKLRPLKLTDADYMKEFTEDEDISRNLLFTRYPFPTENMISFIKTSWEDKRNIHYAIANENDEYIGTISLKNISYIDKNAEYAIVTRKKYWGLNVASLATDKILNYGFYTLNLNKIYLNVLSSNLRAIRFYKKYGFNQEAIFKKHVYRNGDYVDLIWFSYFKNDFNDKRFKP